ncbi:hypothetical protein BS78_03G141000 [Paspalum vaginatum]|nr:hypothetical protein BS78_03G141000 [Paspalum vaginatum]
MVPSTVNWRLRHCLQRPSAHARTASARTASRPPAPTPTAFAHAPPLHRLAASIPHRLNPSHTRRRSITLPHCYSLADLPSPTVSSGIRCHRSYMEVCVIRRQIRRSRTASSRRRWIRHPWPPRDLLRLCRYTLLHPHSVASLQPTDSTRRPALLSVAASPTHAPAVTDPRAPTVPPAPRHPVAGPARPARRRPSDPPTLVPCAGPERPEHRRASLSRTLPSAAAPQAASGPARTAWCREPQPRGTTPADPLHPKRLTSITRGALALDHQQEYCSLLESLTDDLYSI